MNMKQLIARQENDNVKFEVAKKIREVLDEARKAYGPQAWDEADIESEISELVFSE